MSQSRRIMKEANQLTEQELASFMIEIEKMPTLKAPIDGKQTRLCFEFMEDTGCRVNETIHVKKKDINFDTRILTVMFPKSEITCSCSKWKYRDQYTRVRILEYANSTCKTCHGRGKWKQPQSTTITPRLIDKIMFYCNTLKDDDTLFPITRKTLLIWGKQAGYNAGIFIFQQKKVRSIDGIFLHLFRALCSKRMIRDAMNDPYKDQLVACKLRHTFSTVTDRYTKIDINYLWAWEEKTYKRESIV